jgi:protein-tyrosine phosphatase
MNNRNPRYRALAATVAFASLAIITACSSATGSAVPSPSMPAHKTVVLLDTGNTGRSVMAEAIAKKFLADKGWTDITVIGRGIAIDAKETSPEAFAAQLLKDRGIDVSQHRAAQLSAKEAADATIILPVSFKNLGQVLTIYPDTRDKSFLLGDYSVGQKTDIEDAYGKDLPVYQKALSQVDEYVPAALTKIHKG